MLRPEAAAKPGHELELFQHAVNWKKYYASHLAPYITGDVLEVGAGLGSTSRYLCRERPRSWTCLEPDARQAARIRDALSSTPLPVPARVVCGTLADVAQDEAFDTLVYIDVLEHIYDDRGELVLGARAVRPGGHVVVLAPAHPWLFSPFDRAVGHHRRYTAAALERAAPRDLRLLASYYLDSLGILMLLANRVLIGAERPTRSQIRFWDAVLIAASRIVDPVLGYRVGKTVVAVWTKAPAARELA